jgi:hypothetical protein
MAVSPLVVWVGLALLALLAFALLVFFFAAIRFILLSDDCERKQYMGIAPPNKKSPTSYARRQNKWQTGSRAMSMFIVESNPCNPIGLILLYITL